MMAFENPRNNNQVEIGKLRPTEREVMSMLTKVADLEFLRRIDEAFICLRPIWQDLDSQPFVEGFSVPVQAEILLRCGALLSFYAHYLTVPEQQKRARLWLEKSAELFTTLRLTDKIVEAETEMAMTFWREKRSDKALSVLQEANAKVDNDLCAVNIKNLSYQLLVLSTEKSDEHLKLGRELMRDKDIFAQLSQDSRVKVLYYNNSALMMRRLGEMSEALIRFQRCVQFCQEVGNKYTYAVAENNIAYQYRHFKQYDLALEHWKISNKLVLDLGMKIREAEIYDTLAVILLEKLVHERSNDFAEPLKAINKAIEILRTIGTKQGMAWSKSGINDTTSLIVALQTKTRIFLHQGKIADALIIFAEICQIAKDVFGEAAVIDYARDFGQMINFSPGVAFDEEVKLFEKKMLETALIDSSKVLPLAAKSLALPEKRLVEMLDTKHSDLRSRLRIDTTKSKHVKFLQSNSQDEADSTMPPALSSINQKFSVYNCNDHEALIPDNIDVKMFLAIQENRLENIGLVEGRVAVISPFQSKSEYPILVREFITSKFHYGYKIESCGMIALDSDNPDLHPPRVFMPEDIEIVGIITGYLSFDASEKIYNFSALPERTIYI